VKNQKKVPPKVFQATDFKIELVFWLFLQLKQKYKFIRNILLEIITRLKFMF